MHHARPALPVALLVATVLAITVGAPVANAAITARGSVGEAYVTGAAKGATVTLLDKGGKAGGWGGGGWAGRGGRGGGPPRAARRGGWGCRRGGGEHFGFEDLPRRGA